MKDKLLDFIKGIIIGIGNIMPGFSGGTMAVSFNVYDRIIHALSNFFKKPIKVIKDIWMLALGMGVGILLAFIILKFLLDRFPIPTYFFLIGLIIGTIPNIASRAKLDGPKKYDLNSIIAFVVGFVLIVSLLVLSSFFNKTSSEEYVYKLGGNQLITLFMIGLVIAPIMLTPGASAFLILSIIGYDKYVIGLPNVLLKEIIALNFENTFMYILLIIAIALGFGIGLLSFAKLIEKLIDSHPKIFYATVLGLLIASPFAVIFEQYKNYKEQIKADLILNWIFGFLFLTLGVIASVYLTKFEDKTHSEEVAKG